ncbi:hypothetical protein Pyrde_1248 [Pyrodictium delaneyi]|uniref:Uncharacterized protein n=1 Tax=Pyrodictium delaneyi TaxID=1273541 RepID=A0A0P0N3W2_9CREN|nr:hypothetical protein Pyrde_1248 [Pyrodictium delaneyi]
MPCKDIHTRNPGIASSIDTPPHDNRRSRAFSEQRHIPNELPRAGIIGVNCVV